MGCGEPPARADRGVTPFYNPETKRLEHVTYDRNADGRVDATIYIEGAVVRRAELDEDFDGTIDRREYFVTTEDLSARRQPATTFLERVEISGRPDGQVTRWERYEGGTLSRVEEDTTGDGRVDKWETWEGGSLSVVALDTRGRGRPDRRLVYSPGGGEPRLEIDEDGSGTLAPTAARK